MVAENQTTNPGERDGLEPSYRKLPGSGYRRLLPGWALVLLFFVIGIFVLLLRGRRVQLWSGKDHLLQVEWDGYREYYKRFRYGDIQSLTMVRTQESLMITALLGVATFVFALFGVVAAALELRIVMMSVAGLLAVLAVVNLAGGPTCRCFLRTAVQQEELASLTRVRNARRVLDALRPLIAEAQGPFEAAGEPAAAPPGPPANPGAPAEPPPPGP